MEAIQAALLKLGEARTKLEAVGVSKDSITSDSVSMRERSVILKDGIEVEDDGEEESQPVFAFGGITVGLRMFMTHP